VVKAPSEPRLCVVCASETRRRCGGCRVVRLCGPGCQHSYTGVRDTTREEAHTMTMTVATRWSFDLCNMLIIARPNRSRW
jgi:hypothetical protein